MPLVGDFAGKDLKVSWTRNPGNDDTTAITYDYGVDIYVNSSLVHSARTTQENYTYYYDDMVQDQTTPSRECEVRVSERSTFLVESADASATFTNPKPTAPGFALSAVTNQNIIEIDTTNINDTDLAGFFVYRSLTSQSTLDPLNLIYTGPEKNIIDTQIAPNTTYYYQVVAFDMFDNNPDNYTAFTEQSVTSTDDTLEGAPSYKTTNLDFYKVSTNTIGWNAGTAYRAGNLTNQTKAIPAGQYAWTSGAVYLYFDWASGAVLNTTSLATALQPDTILLAKYTGGNNIHNGTKDIIYDGTNIVAGSIGATQFIAGVVLITGTAQLANTVIANANILGGEITVDKANTANFAVADLAVFGGTLQSNNYVANTSGWQITEDGYAEFDNVLVRNSFQEGTASDYSQQSLVTSVTLTHRFDAYDYDFALEVARFTAFAYQKGIPNVLHFSFDMTSDRDSNLPAPIWQSQDYPFYVDARLQQRHDNGDGGGWSDWGFVDHQGLTPGTGGYSTYEVPYEFPYSTDFYDFGTIEMATIVEFGFPRTIQYRVVVDFYQKAGEERTWTLDNFTLKQKRIFN